MCASEMGLLDRIDLVTQHDVLLDMERCQDLQMGKRFTKGMDPLETDPITDCHQQGTSVQGLEIRDRTGNKII